MAIRSTRGLLLALLLLIPMSVSAGLVNINTASVVELDTLPGIGPAKAAAIIDYRTAQGAFATIAEIQEVKGIGPSTYEGLKDLITVSGGLSEKPQSQAPGSTKKQTIDSAATTNLTTQYHAPEPVAAERNAAALAAAVPFGAERLTTSSWTLAFLVLVAVAGGFLLVW